MDTENINFAFMVPCIIIQLLQKFHIHGSVHHDTNVTKMTNKMQLCRIIYCFLTSLHVSSDNIVRNMYSSQETINYPTQMHFVGHFVTNEDI
jgi:hypothetical protein